MRLLILSCNTGEGHNSAAKAVRDCFEKSNISCDIMDALAFWSPKKSKIISKGHIFIYRNLPKLFGVGYRYEENHPPKDGDESIIYELVIKGCDGLEEFLLNNPFDGVICTHVFSAMMMTELKKHRKCSIKTYFIFTDYTCYPGVDQTAIDVYFIPHRNLTEEFMQSGIPKSKIVPVGIPVNSVFYIKTDKNKAKRSLSLPQNKKVVLLMCGSMGCGPIKEIAEYLPTILPKDAILTVICGSNKKLYKTLNKDDLPENLIIKGFTSRMSLYMDAADLVLTKPGGLSTTEAAAKALPMLFIDAVPGCETRNHEFFMKHGCADMRENLNELCETVCEYLNNSDRLKQMSDKLSKEFSSCAVELIKDYIIEDESINYGGLQKTPIK